MTIIGIAGRKRAGKDTVADIISKQTGTFVKRPLAKPLKDALKTICGFSDEQLYGNLKETVDPNWGFTPRLAAQVFGAEAMREGFGQAMVEHGVFGPDEVKDFWIKATMLRRQPGEDTILSDVRYMNEAYAVLKQGGYIIHVKNPRLTYAKDLHSSEAGLDWDALKEYQKKIAVIVNDGDLKSLEEKVKAWIQSFLKSV